MRIATYTSSSDAVADRFRDAARAYGTVLGERGIGLVYGGTAVGLMGEVAAAVRAAGGEVAGVLPQRMADRGLADEACDELVVTTTMAERKRQMMARADAFVALPGGFGTLEELFEVLTLKQLGYHGAPIVLFDVDGFWGGLLRFFDQLYAQSFAAEVYRGLYTVTDDLEELLEVATQPSSDQLPTKRF